MKIKDLLTLLNIEIDAEKMDLLIKQFVIIGKEIQNSLNIFLVKNQDVIKLWMQFSKIYPQIEPYLNKVENELQNPEFEIGNDIISILDIIEEIDLGKDENLFTILDVLRGSSLQNSLVVLYNQSGLDTKRLILIKEALILHNKKYYAGSICLFYSLIEGILTEYLLNEGFLVRDGDFLFEKSTYKNKKNKVVGLSRKMDSIISNSKNDSVFFINMKRVELINGNANETIVKTRNKILHGEDLVFNSEKRSAQLLLWLYSVIARTGILPKIN